jgi:hypothetical protein
MTADVVENNESLQKLRNDLCFGVVQILSFAINKCEEVTTKTTLVLASLFLHSSPIDVTTDSDEILHV